LINNSIKKQRNVNPKLKCPLNYQSENVPSSNEGF
jgi:hypothetical protein